MDAGHLTVASPCAVVVIVLGGGHAVLEIGLQLGLGLLAAYTTRGRLWWWFILGCILGHDGMEVTASECEAITGHVRSPHNSRASRAQV